MQRAAAMGAGNVCIAYLLAAIWAKARFVFIAAMGAECRA